MKNFLKVIPYRKQRIITIFPLILIFTSLFSYVQSQTSEQASIVFLRPGDVDEDPFDVFIDSLLVCKIKPQSITSIEFPAGDHWLILRYGYHSFLHHEKKYDGTVLNLGYGEKKFFRSNYKTIGGMFRKIDTDTLSHNAVDSIIAANEIKNDMSYSYEQPLSVISKRKFEKMVKDMIADSAVYTFRIGGSQIKIYPGEIAARNDSSKIDSSKTNELKTEIDDSTIEKIPQIPRSPEELRPKITASKIFHVVGISLIPAGAALLIAGQTCSIAKHETLGNVLFPVGGVTLAGGIVLTVKTKKRIKRYKEEEERFQEIPVEIK